MATILIIKYNIYNICIVLSLDILAPHLFSQYWGEREREREIERHKKSLTEVLKDRALHPIQYERLHLLHHSISLLLVLALYCNH